MSQQPTLFNTNERPTHRPVRETSRAAYDLGRDKWVGRKRLISVGLEHYFFCMGDRVPPTSAELARWMKQAGTFEMPNEWTASLLLVRRGLSDLLNVGAVENPKGVEGKLLKRPCAVTGSNCYVWRVRQR